MMALQYFGIGCYIQAGRKKMPRMRKKNKKKYRNPGFFPASIGFILV
jgi:hypothetical protein